MKVRLQPNNVYFKKHENKIKVFIHDPNSNKTVKKALKFFWGKDYSIQTDTNFWNEEKRCFREYSDKKGKCPIKSAQTDNSRLTSLYARIANILENAECYTPEDLYTAYNAALGICAKASTSKQTLLDYAIYYRNLWESGEITKYQSGNFVIYDKLIHKLQGTFKGEIMPWANKAKKFASMPIESINNETFSDWCKFIAANRLGYRDSVNAFRATVYYYQRKEKGNKSFRFTHSVLEDQPKAEMKKGYETFTEEQLTMLFNFDVSLIFPKMTKAIKELYIDTCILMYGLYSRPVDTLSIKIEDIQKDRTNKSFIWKYCPKKKENYDFKKVADRNYGVPISNVCLTIIKKYTKGRKSGYLLPFKMNEEEKEWKKRKIQVNHTACKIGKFLQEIAKYHQWDIRPSMYSLRHTAITHLLKQKENIETVAVFAKTSMKQIELTYMSKEDVATSINANKAFYGIAINR